MFHKILLSLCILPMMALDTMASIQIETESDIEIPDSFDAREKWTFCESIGKVRNSRNCNAGWVFAAITTMTDRLCIQSNGTIKFEFSPQDLLSCCKRCHQCNPGNATEAWQYWIDNGIVSGGDYGDNEGCKPYGYNPAITVNIPSCDNRCQTGYNVSYDDDKYYGDSFYKIEQNVAAIQKEILVNGPVQAFLYTFEDFFFIKNGSIYQHDPIYGTMGYTFVKIIGWGSENGTPFWIAATSWGSNFLENGFFKILRGTNEAGIEENVIAGVAKLDSGPPDSDGIVSVKTSSIVFISFSIFLVNTHTLLRNKFL